MSEQYVISGTHRIELFPISMNMALSSLSLPGKSGGVIGIWGRSKKLNCQLKPGLVIYQKAYRYLISQRRRVRREIYRYS
jgi:hypothetical protein